MTMKVRRQRLKTMPIKGLYAITPDFSQTDELLDKVKKALQGGVALLQYRNKSANNKLLREQAQALISLCRQYHVPMIMNDHLDLAIETDADGVHLGQEDLTHNDVNVELADTIKSWAYHAITVSNWRYRRRTWEQIIWLLALFSPL